MPKFIKLTNIEKDCSHLNICIDSIEEFYRHHPISTFETSDGKKMSVTKNEEECTRVYLKSSGSYHNVSETTEEVEALIKEIELTEYNSYGEIVHIKEIVA